MTTRHVCTFFEDGDDLLCVCGIRALVILDEDTGERVTVILADDPADRWVASA